MNVIPQNDYDACCNVTLGTHLGAGASNVIPFITHGYPCDEVTANAFATRTFMVTDIAVFTKCWIRKIKHRWVCLLI